MADRAKSGKYTWEININGWYRRREDNGDQPNLNLLKWDSKKMGKGFYLLTNNSYFILKPLSVPRGTVMQNEKALINDRLLSDTG